MADTTQSEQLEKRAPETPAPDPIADQSMSGALLISSLLLVVTLIWSLYDEVIGQRPWKGYQKDFVSNYSEYLKKAKRRQKNLEQEVKSSPEYQEFDQAFKDEAAAAKERTDPIDAQVKKTDTRINEITAPFQDARSWIVAKTYEMEVSGSDSGKRSIREAIEKKKQEKIEFKMTGDDGKEEEKSLTFVDLDALYNSLRDEKARLLAERVQVTQPVEATRKKRDVYLQDHLFGLTEEQVAKLEDKTENFK
ncbi:MAG: hypothetical protein WAV20_04935, partial [Blastocatellia bacterium]